MIFFFFFFSSRRRHTRLQGDWSSDVCSSDLDVAIARLEGRDIVPAETERRIVRRRLAKRGQRVRHVTRAPSRKIGRASCRERVYTAGVGEEATKKRKEVDKIRTETRTGDV